MKTYKKIITLSAVAVLFAAKTTEGGEINRRALPQHMSYAKALFLSTKADKKQHQLLEQEKKQREALMLDLKRIDDDVRKALHQALRNDRFLNMQYGKLKNAYMDVIKSNLSGDQKQRRLLELSKEMEDVIASLVKKSKINEELYKKQIMNTAQKHYLRNGKKLKFKYLGYLSYWLGEAESRTQPIDEQEVTLTAPFPYSERVRGLHGNVRANGEAGEYYANSGSYFVGYGEALAGLGHFFRMPEERYSRVRVSARLPETSFSLFAEAILGFSSSWARSQIIVETEGEASCNSSKDHGTLIAPVLWFAIESGTDNIVVNCEIRAPRPNEDIVVKFHSIAGAFAVVGAASFASVTGKPEEIRIRLIP